MNARQRKFAQLYASDPNATQAAIKAGYSEKTSYSIGQENLKKPEIVEYIQELQAEAESERIASIIEIKQFWTQILRDNKERTDHRLKASELLAKAGAAFINRVEVETEVQTENDVIFYIPLNGREVLTDLEETE